MVVTALPPDSLARVVTQRKLNNTFVGYYTGYYTMLKSKTTFIPCAHDTGNHMEVPVHRIRRATGGFLAIWRKHHKIDAHTEAQVVSEGVVPPAG